MEGAQTSAAYFYFDRSAATVQGLFVDVSLEPSLGVAVGVTDVVAAHPRFQTNFTAHVVSLFFNGQLTQSARSLYECRWLRLTQWLAQKQEYSGRLVPAAYPPGYPSRAYRIYKAVFQTDSSLT